MDLYETLQGCLIGATAYWLFTVAMAFLKKPIDTDGNTMNELNAIDILDLINVLHSKMNSLGYGNVEEVKKYAKQVIDDLSNRNRLRINEQQRLDIEHRMMECFS